MSSLRVVNAAVSPLQTPPSESGSQPDIGTNDDQHDHGLYQQYRNHQLNDDWKPSPLPSASNSPVLTNAILHDFPSPPSLAHDDSMFRKAAPTASPRVFDLQQESPSVHYTSRSQLDLQQSDLASIQENESQNDEDDFNLGSYDLKPPPPPPFLQNGLETLMDRLHSTDHLDIILSDARQSAQFFRFIETYREVHLSSIKQYLSARKALAALDFANALASRIPTNHQPYVAATLDPRFEAKVQRMIDEVLEDALPAYVTYRLVRLATDSLVKEITGTGSPVMRTLIPDLATVYCISDPSLMDNPIVYASEEFHSTTLYTPAQCLNRNCRFLQGPHTSQASIRRLVAALTAGKEISETILNYRRDGSPFVNLLMIAPLYDNKGAVRYFLGCQIDVSALVEEGKGLESFNTLLAQDRDLQRYANDQSARHGSKDPDQALSDLAARLSVDENNPSSLPQHHRPLSTSYNRLSSLTSTHTTTTNPPNHISTPSSRQRLVLTDDPQQDPQLYPHISLGSSGRLPGVYQNYLLVRPFPSLRITFLSPSLRIPGLLQSAFLDRIAGPESIREGLKDAFMRGIGVTAKVLWNSSSSTSSSTTLGSTTSSSRGGHENHDRRRESRRFSSGSYNSILSSQNTPAHPLQSHPPHYTPSRPAPAMAGSEQHHHHYPGYRPPLASHPKSRWIHCTPLMGSDGKVGVWMVVMVEEEGTVTGGLKRAGSTATPPGGGGPGVAMGMGMQDSGIAGLGPDGREGSGGMPVGGRRGGNFSHGGSTLAGAVGGIDVRDMATGREGETDSSLASSPAAERDLYAEYLRSESRAGFGAERDRSGMSETSGSLRRRRRDDEDFFRGF